MALLRAFKREYHDELHDLHRSQFNMQAFLEEVSYYLEFARASGSPETASFNGMDNAFVAYYHFRLNRSDGTPGLKPLNAWTSLGIYGGDDGLTADVDPNNYSRAAKSVGHELTVELIQRGEFGVSFLARMYSPEVWEGCMDSCCDLPRQLGKFHATVNLPQSVTPTRKFLEKCFSYWLTDENTPIIGELVEKARLLLNSEFEHDPRLRPMASWGSQFPKGVQYPNNPGDWMMAYAVSVLPDMNYNAFKDWLSKADSLEYLQRPPLLQEAKVAKPSQPVVVNGDIIPGPKGELLLPVPTCKLETCQLGCRCKDVPDPKSKDDGEGWSKQRQQKKRDVKADRFDITKETFEEWKARRIAAGTWVEKPEKKK